jgi:3-phosphoshikimate 1-carboxyvinyltransferase
MRKLMVHPSGPLRGAVTIPGDKSISHRALLLSALAEGDTAIHGWVDADVCQATLRCVRALGVPVDAHGAGALTVHGVGLNGLTEPADVLDCAGSGTTIRLLAGILAGQPFTSVVTGSEALRRRPMGRVAEPLRLMGATVLGRQDGKLPPLTIRGGSLRGIDYAMPVASAQVKSAILLAGLFAAGETIVHEPGPARDHTERMLAEFKVEVQVEAEGRGSAIRLRGGQKLIGGGTLYVPGDFSSAAFPLVAAALIPGSEVRLCGVGVNPTRTGLYDLLAEMGAAVEVVRTIAEAQQIGEWPERRATLSANQQMAGTAGHAVGKGAPPPHRVTVSPCHPATLHPSSVRGEPLADLTIRGSALRGIAVGGEFVVRAIDEFPIFAVAATQATGVTTIREAAELRVKESDRIATVAGELRKMGAQVEERPDGMILHGPARLHGAVVECHRDHRLAMSLAVAGLVADGPTEIRGAEAINDSFPGFVETMRELGADVAWVDGE